jgi:hypothetical protein
VGAGGHPARILTYLYVQDRRGLCLTDGAYVQDTFLTAQEKN